MPPPRKKILRRAWIPLLLLLAAVAPAQTLAVPGPDVFDVQELAAGTPTSHHHHHLILPRYSPGTDGLWRRVESYTLMGSTICDTCTATPTPSIPPTDDEIRANIPEEWIKTTPSTPARTAITVTLSVVLACFIFLTLLRFHYTRRPGDKSRIDIEKKRHRSKLAASTETLHTLKPSAGKRKWIARWRDNARLLGRQRRMHRANQPQQQQQQQPLVSSSRPGSTESLVSEAPRSVSPIPSISSAASSIATHTSASTSSLVSLAPPPSPPPSPHPNEPPAYPVSPGPSRAARGKARDMRDVLGPVDYLDGDVDGEAFPPYSPREAGSVEDDFTERRGPHSAHVATDDKALLARLAEGASEPSSSRSSAPPSASGGEQEAEARAPEEDDLDLFVDLTDEAGASGSGSRPSSSQLQPPPPHSSSSHPFTLTLPPPPPPPPLGTRHAYGSEKMALERAYAVREAAAASSSSVYDDDREVPMYPSAPAYAYEDSDAPEAGPSTPRAFVASAPSAPPLEEDDFYDDGYGYGGGEGASAPPLFEEEEEEENCDGDGDVCRDESLRPPPPSPPHDQPQQQALGEREEEGEDTQQPRRDRHSAGEAHDTGWGGGG